MAWEKRGKARFYYRSARAGGRVKKVYCGGGNLGRVAAEVDARRREERQARLAALAAERGRLEEVLALLRRLDGECRLLTEAVLLVNGFHRPNRVAWRKWDEARRTAAVEHRAGAGGRR
jgi:hypothetical protein